VGSSGFGRALRQGTGCPVHREHHAGSHSQSAADHGDLSGILPADGGDCEEVLARFAKAGVDVDALATQLQDEGAKSFVKSWSDLMEVLVSKSADLRKAS